MRGLPEISANVRSAADEGGYAPARQEDSTDHDQRDSDGRNVGIDELDGSFCTTQPCAGSEAAEYAERLQAA